MVSVPRRKLSLDAVLARLEATDPAVGQAAAQLNEVTSSIVERANEERDGVHRTLAKVGQERDATVAKLTAELDEARAELALLRDADVIIAYDAWHCDDGHRYAYPVAASHALCDRPLQPVRVTITRRTT